MKNIIFILGILMSSLLSFAQDSNIIWQRTIGGEGSEFSPQIIETNDGNILIAGGSDSNISGEKTENSNGEIDIWILKLNSDGEIIWQNTIGGEGLDTLKSISNTIDGGYLIGGTSNSDISGDKTENSRGGSDYWIIKLDNFGDILWQKTIGGNAFDSLTNVIETPDNTYIVSGSSQSTISGDRIVPNSNGEQDIWFLKLDSDLSILYQTSNGFGNSFFYQSVDLDITNNGDYIISGMFGAVSIQDSFYISRIKPDGATIWEQEYGGDGSEISPFLEPTIEGDILVAGTSSSDISGDKTEDSNLLDYWILELNESGNINWQNTIGGFEYDSLRAIAQTQDGGSILSGQSNSDAGLDKEESSRGSNDYWIMKLNPLGIIEWQNTIGGSNSDSFPTIIEDNEGNFYIAGTSSSNISFEKTENSRGGNDFWVLKLNNTLGINETELFKNVSIYPNPAQTTLNISILNQEIDRIKIFSLDGKLMDVIENYTKNNTVDISKYSNGPYLVQLKAGNQIFSKKFIKQ